MLRTWDVNFLNANNYRLVNSMKDFLKIFKWFERNLFKLIFISIGAIIIYTIVIFLIPFFLVQINYPLHHPLFLL